MRRIAAICLVLSICVSMLCLGVSATQSRTAYFSEDYELTGTGASDMVAIAVAQEGRTGSQMGYTEEWCANFISDCAVLAGQSSAIPANGACSGLYQNIVNAGGKVTTSDPRPGDICFINWNGGSSMQHVEIVYAVSGGSVYTIGGNSGSGGSLYSRYVRTHAPLSDSYIVKIVRPAYVTTKVSYISQCSWYSAYCQILVTADSAALMSQPCTVGISEDSALVSTVASGSSLTATALAVNTEGEIWYRVSVGGATGYICASETEFVQVLSDVTANGISAPEELEQGDKFSVGGKITVEYSDIVSVSAYVLSGDSTQTGTSVSIDTRSYSLKGSKVDKGLAFSKLTAGNYTYVILAETESYYASDGGNLEKAVTETELFRDEFTVAEPHVCDRDVLVGYGGEHPHYAVYECSGCVARIVSQEQTQRDESCEICFPMETPPEPEVPDETVPEPEPLPEVTPIPDVDAAPIGQPLFVEYLISISVLSGYAEAVVKLPRCCHAVLVFVLSALPEIPD